VIWPAAGSRFYQQLERTKGRESMRRYELLRPLRRGLTLIELTIVMLIMGIMAAAASPRYFESISRFRVEAAATRIAADLNHVRGRAKMKGPLEEEWVCFYPATEKYEMVDDPDPDREANEYWVDLSKTAYPVDLVSATFVSTSGFTSSKTVKFDLFGMARVGNSPILPLASGQIIVQCGGQQRTITIDPVTGEASVL
jgi:prepilin-type N-terminal cleavage/methylation domain-containing protein